VSEAATAGVSHAHETRTEVCRICGAVALIGSAGDRSAMRQQLRS
jgi:hypothetical protein